MAGYARTYDEAHLYMGLRPCECGESELDTQSRSERSGGVVLEHYTGFCPRCGRRREFTFEMPAELPELGFTIRYGPDGEPSRLLDPGEWLNAADGFADSARLVLSADQPSGEDLTDAYYLLSSAVAAAEEVLKFVPPGADAVPPTAFRNLAGIQVYEAVPDRFRLDSLRRDLAEHQRDADDFESRYHNTE